MNDANIPYSIIPDPYSENALEVMLEFAGVQNSASLAHTLNRILSIGLSRLEIAELIRHLTILLGNTGSPAKVITSLDRFLQNSPQPEQILKDLSNNPRKLEMLALLFAGSHFLTEILVRNPGYYGFVSAIPHGAQPKTLNEFRDEAIQTLSECTVSTEALDSIRRYQRSEFFRIGLCDLLGLFDLTTVTDQLSGLADGIIHACLTHVERQLGESSDGLYILALGKLGGAELNYSSDIDLLFISETEPTRFIRIGEKLIQALSFVSSEGFLYRVDMRLRPWGSVGTLVTSHQGYLAYLRKHARLWEKQTLLKVRCITGNSPKVYELLESISQIIYTSHPDQVRESVQEMKQRTENQLIARGQENGEVKLGQGSIRDIEFIVQFLQLAYGGQDKSIRNPNTLIALNLLTQRQYLSVEESRTLSEGYIFLRTIEHHLQLMDYRQTHYLPTQAEAISSLARRLSFTGDKAGENFILRYQQHSTAIRSIYLKYIGNYQMPSQPQTQHNSSLQDRVSQHIQRMDASYTDTFPAEEIEQHAIMASRLTNENLVEMNTRLLEDGTWRVTVVAFDYLGELSLICGLMFLHRLNILGGEVFTYEPLPSNQTSDPKQHDSLRKIVDVFTVQPVGPNFQPTIWEVYQRDLIDLLRLMHGGKRREARGQLAQRVALTFHELTQDLSPLYPIEITIDNQSSRKYTLLRIESVDTIGFLYELTNSLAYSRIHIAHVTIDSVGSRVRDILSVTDDRGEKILSPERQRELRAAIVLIKHFTHLLPHTPNPVSALLHFREFIAQLFERENWLEEITSLEKPEVLDAMARLLGVSDFLWDDFLRMQHANLFPVLRDVDALKTSKSRLELQSELEAALLPVHNGPQNPREDAPWKYVLNEFKDREMFRIDMRHILGHTREFDEFAEELTDLAEVIINSAYHLTAEDLRSVYGTPRSLDGTISQMCVCALGKCGGRELGFASDIELMFVYDANGVTSGPEEISSAEFHEKTVQYFIQAIHARREGIFEVDLQLRPYGKAGTMAVSFDAFRRYFAPQGPAWAYERQALVKLRPIAGDRVLGGKITALRDEFLYTGQPFDTNAMRAMRERQLRHLVTAGKFHPKYSPGGLVDIEYLVQGLQISYGHLGKDLRVTNTRQAMKALAEAGILTPQDYTQLRKAHTFLRWLIDSLRVVRGNAKDVNIPQEDTEEYAYLARRLQFGANISQLRIDLNNHTQNVQRINTQLLR